MIDELADCRGRVVHRDRETEPDVSAGGRCDPGVDPHHLPLDVHEGAAGVALIDCRVRLDVIRVCRHVTRGSMPAERAHDPHGDRGFKSQRVSNRQHDVSHLESVGISELRHLHGIRAREGDKSDILPRVGANHLGLEDFLVIQAHADVVGIFDHVVVGQDVIAVTGPLNDDPRPKSGLSERPLAAVALLVEERKGEIERKIELRNLLGDRFRHVDLHHGWQDLPCHFPEGALQRLQTPRNLHERRFAVMSCPW